MKYWGLIFVVLLMACTNVSTPLPLSTETPIPNTATPQVIEVTRVVRAVRTVVVTATPQPLLSQDCWNVAVSQSELTSCAALEAELAREAMDELILQIEFSSEQQKKNFGRLQIEWEALIAEDCEFLFAQIVTEEDGSLHYAGGSMAPMQRNFCLAEQYKRRMQDLRYAYFPQ